MRITLCGSTRFKSKFMYYNEKLGKMGHTVYNLSCFGTEPGHPEKKDLEGPLLTEEEKMTLDLVHLDKILNSDAILVINPEGYIGNSTRREIAWASIQERLKLFTERTGIDDVTEYRLRGYNGHYWTFYKGNPL